MAVRNTRARQARTRPIEAQSAEVELRRTLMTCLLWEDTIYESGDSIANRIAELAPQIEPSTIVAMAVEARQKLHLRHAPLWLIRCLAKQPGSGIWVARALPQIIERADELAEFLALYWKDNNGRKTLAAGVKRGLARAFTKFNAYALAKYDQKDNPVKLRDVLFLCHASPGNPEQAALWRKLVDGTLEPPDTWEVALSAGADKKATWERLLREGKLGGLAVLRNLRNMQSAGVDTALIQRRLNQGISRAFPYRFITAARYAPALEESIERAMFKAIEGIPELKGRTGPLVDVSGSMDEALAKPGSHGNRPRTGEPTTRIDVACGLAILLRERAESVSIVTFSTETVLLPPRRGFALRDAVKNLQPHGGTALRAALVNLQSKLWNKMDRVIVITDEQSQDGCADAWTDKAYIINVAPNKNGVGSEQGWHKVNGWSERVFDYIQMVEGGVNEVSASSD